MGSPSHPATLVLKAGPGDVTVSLQECWAFKILVENKSERDSGLLLILVLVKVGRHLFDRQASDLSESQSPMSWGWERREKCVRKDNRGLLEGLRPWTSLGRGHPLSPQRETEMFLKPICFPGL